MLIHEASRTARVVPLDELEKLAVHLMHVPRDLRGQGAVLLRPRDVLKGNELNDEHAVVRALGNADVKIAAGPREGGAVAHVPLSLGKEPAEAHALGGRRPLGSELGGEALHRALCIDDFPGRHAGELELHGERFGEEGGVSARDARAAAFAHADLRNPECLERTEGIAGDDAAHLEARGEIILGAEKVAGHEPLIEERIANLGHDVR